MTTPATAHDAAHEELVCLYAMQALEPGELPAAEAQIAACAECRRELAGYLDALVAWPADVLRPPAALWDRLAERVRAARGAAVASTPARWEEPAWREVAPGISVKLLASDPARDLVSMLVRLEPGIEYPPHTHAGVEELHLLDGELWINDRKLVPGEYSRAEPGTGDWRVWSETGCTCVLITSPSDVLS